MHDHNVNPHDLQTAPRRLSTDELLAAGSYLRELGFTAYRRSKAPNRVYLHHAGEFLRTVDLETARRMGFDAPVR